MHSKYRTGSDRNRGAPVSVLALLGLLAAGAGLAYVSVKRTQPYRGDHRPPDSAPGRTSRQHRYGEYAVIGNTVTINKPRAELYAYWRDFANLGQFMENIEAVEVTGPDSATWRISGPAGSTVTVKTRVVDDRPDEQIAWRSVEGSEIDTEGKVMFRDAPGGRGTIVEAIVAYRPPAGEMGRWIAKLFQKEPRVQGRRDLKRFKMLMETGEVATSKNRKAA